ncbi:protein FAM151A [Trematomus bernacchii]|uniref:protein FAM151A n=1 Tax=Trematomus bernacchii TaxID=40690 RepID=UPI00146BBE36|nr:protein FAM151A [Trematomus bernacchii]
MGETEERSDRGTEESPERMMPYHRALPAEPQSKLYLGCLNKPQLILISVAAGLVPLIIIITVAAVLATKSDSSTALPSFSTGGDMLDFLLQSGDISSPDGLMATWYHRANSKEEMNKALTSDAMILEADITLEGYGTANENPIPIMAHPPDIYSDNTLDQWMDAVLASRKGMKLDFKTLRSVGLSLDLLSQKSKNSSRGINRPVWINADILLGPNAPAFLPTVNGTSFLQLVQEKFPNVTLSPGWKVAYGPPLFVETYTEAMVKDMYDMIKDVPQKVTFPVHALLGRSGWQHISWLLSQSSRFSLTLWQGSIRPNISDLLFIRENSHPARVYYDIYEPTLSAFKQAASQQGLLRRFYPGGDLMDFLYPNHNSDLLSTAPRRSSLDVRWVRVTDRTSLLETLSGGDGGMLVVQVVSDSNQPGVPLVEGSGKSSEALTLEDLLELLGQRAEAPWGVYLQIHSQQLLEASLTWLHSAYSQEKLYRPVWVSREGPLSPDHNQVFVSTVERLFPYVTLVLKQQNLPAVSQRVALHVNTASLQTGLRAFSLTLLRLMDMTDRYDLIVEDDTPALEGLKEFMSRHTRRAKTHPYLTSDQSQLRRDMTNPPF